MTLFLSQSHADQMIAHARHEYPAECCGVLLGPEDGPDHRVDRIIVASNIAEGDHRTNYQIDWATLFRVVRAERTDPQRIVGFYHSHPDGSTRPSRSDREAVWIDYAYLIVSTDGSSTCCALSCWRVPDENAEFQAETLEIHALSPEPSQRPVSGPSDRGRISDCSTSRITH